VEPLFSSLVAEIEAAYERLGHQLAWRFLYSPARTLAPGTQIATVGANPGGRTYEPPRPSVEEGNALEDGWRGQRDQRSLDKRPTVCFTPETQETSGLLSSKGF
jgi:hypothetical protein